jgi:hypothetical protein
MSDSNGMYAGCERAPFDALFLIECAWARFHAAAYANDRLLCARQLREYHARLGSVDVVGITERWTESMLLVAREIGLRHLPRMRVNVRASASSAAREAPKSAELSACSSELYARWSGSFAQRLASMDAEFNATLAQVLVTLSEGAVRDKGPGLRRRPEASSQAAPADADTARARYARKEARLAARIMTLGDGGTPRDGDAALLTRLRARKARIAALVSSSERTTSVAEPDGPRLPNGTVITTHVSAVGVSGEWQR